MSRTRSGGTKRSEEGWGRSSNWQLVRFLDLLRDMPELGAVVHGGLRRILLVRFPYAIYYRITDKIEVRGCLHQRRHPRAWRRRA